MITVDISVLIVFYRGQVYIEKCLSTLCDVIYTSEETWEILIYDAESTNESKLILDKAISNYPQIKINVVSGRGNLGFGRANNILYDISTGKLIFLLNQDTEIESISMYSIKKVLHDNDKDLIVVPVLKNHDGTTQRNIFRYPSVLKFCADVLIPTSILIKFKKVVNHGLPEKCKDSYSAIKYYPSGAAVIINRKLIDEYDLFDKYFFMYHEECDFFMRVKNVSRYLYEKDIVIKHYGSGGVPLSAEMVSEYYCNLAYILSKKSIKSIRFKALIYVYSLSLGIRCFLGAAGLGNIYKSPTSCLYKQSESGECAYDYKAKAVKYMRNKIRIS